MHCFYLQVVLATCVLSNSAQLQLRTENQTEVASRYRDLVNERGLILSKDVTCTAQGVTPIGCTSFKVCAFQGGVLVGAIGKCYPENFNPNTQRCDPAYVCPPCKKAGFICLKNNAAFRLCAGPDIVVVQEQDCPSGFYCNEKCSLPCLDQVQNC
jgi:hypothetical protein